MPEIELSTRRSTCAERQRLLRSHDERKGAPRPGRFGPWLERPGRRARKNYGGSKRRQIQCFETVRGLLQGRNRQAPNRLDLQEPAFPPTLEKCGECGSERGTRTP